VGFSAPPILLQLEPMLYSPLENHAVDPLWQPTRQDGQSLHRYDTRVLGIVGVEVSRTVVFVVHPDLDPEESADGRHGTLVPSKTDPSAGTWRSAAKGIPDSRFLGGKTASLGD
jgi:hypothetical protein